ncbi:MAG: hypothetical protein U9O24_03230 [Campylobacterota bacterium]|nr:hypothetical protein [Campylobacterota bacterium]
MHILLINNNPIVSQLISLSVREMSMNLEEVDSINAILRDSYEIVFIDEASYTDEILVNLSRLFIGQTVFLSNGKTFNDEKNLFHIVLKKPFLPTQITTILKNIKVEEASHSFDLDESPSIFPLATDKDNKKLISVLDTDEIEQIKALLQTNESEIATVSSKNYEEKKREVITEQLIADGLEIVHEDEYIKSLEKKEKKKKRKKRQLTFEEKLLLAVSKMKTKKIKKLLKHADITIKIKFKDK